jgi:hypothetical protein
MADEIGRGGADERPTLSRPMIGRISRVVDPAPTSTQGVSK